VATVEGTAPGAASVVIDDTAATVALIRHLQSLGHERIGTITLPRDAARETALATDDMLEENLWTSTYHRLLAFKEAGVEPCVVVEARASMVQEGIAAGHLALSHPSAPTALVCQSDLLAAGVLLAARELELDIPGDVSITGFDGIELAWLEGARLTTVFQDSAAKGHLIAQAVKGLLDGEEPSILELGLEMRVGNTTGPARR
jgi:DNA-binding LacI/PurR family transcriptional regulator